MANLHASFLHLIGLHHHDCAERFHLPPDTAGVVNAIEMFRMATARMAAVAPLALCGLAGGFRFNFDRGQKVVEKLLRYLHHMQDDFTGSSLSAGILAALMISERILFELRIPNPPACSCMVGNFMKHGAHGLHL